MHQDCPVCRRPAWRPQSRRGNPTHSRQAGPGERERIELIAVPATRPGDLLDSLNEYKPAIVQFSGHGIKGGNVDAAGPQSGVAGNRDFISPAGLGEGHIVLVGEDGLPRPVSKTGLVSLFRLRHDIVKIVVLNACYTRGQAEAIAEHVDCVIGTDQGIKDEAVRVFAARFYRSLAEGNSVATAFEEARIELELQGFEDQAAIPRLFHRKDVDPARVYLSQRGSEAEVFPQSAPPVPPRSRRWIPIGIVSAIVVSGICYPGAISFGPWDHRQAEQRPQAGGPGDASIEAATPPAREVPPQKLPLLSLIFERMSSRRRQAPSS